MRTEVLEERLRGRSVFITLVSDTNALLFTLCSRKWRGAASNQPHNAPLRSSLHRTEFIRGSAEAIDVEQRRVILRADHGTDPHGKSSSTIWSWHSLGFNYLEWRTFRGCLRLQDVA